jgi:hypothetical protein
MYYDFKSGQQPCQNYSPKQDGNGYGTWNNVHECFCGHSKGKTCGKAVSQCENCNRDHHEDGYENCQCGGKGFE